MNEDELHHNKNTLFSIDKEKLRRVPFGTDSIRAMEIFPLL